MKYANLKAEKGALCTEDRNKIYKENCSDELENMIKDKKQPYSTWLDDNQLEYKEEYINLR